MVNHVGRPWMLEGKRFLPETGTPIWKMDLMRTLFAVCEPEPLAVATCSEKSLTTTSLPPATRSPSSVATVDIVRLPPVPGTLQAPRVCEAWILARARRSADRVAGALAEAIFAVP